MTAPTSHPSPTASDLITTDTTTSDTDKGPLPDTLIADGGDPIQKFSNQVCTCRVYSKDASGNYTTPLGDSNSCITQVSIIAVKCYDSFYCNEWPVVTTKGYTCLLKYEKQAKCECP